MKPLSPKQEAFCREYLIDLNGTRAAIRAGYSERTANEQAARLLANVSIRIRVDALMEERRESLSMDAKQVLEELCAMAKMDWSDILNPDRSIKPIDEWPPIWRRAVQHMESESVGPDDPIWVTKVKISDRVKVLELIGRHINVNAFEARNQANIKARLSNLSDLFTMAEKGLITKEELDHMKAAIIHGDQ